MAQAACARGLPGWERLLTARDPALRAVLRRTLTAAIDEHDEHEAATYKRLEVVVQRGVAQAFK